MPGSVRDILIQAALYPVATFVVLLGVWAVLSRSVAVRERVIGLLDRRGPALACGVAVLVLASFVGFGAWYASQLGFASEVEPMVTSVAGLLHHGGQLYHSPDAPQRYSVLYGPTVFIATNVAFALFGLTISAAKIGAFVALLSSLALLFATLRRHVNEWTAVVLTGVGALLVWTCGSSAFVVRPDAYLLAGASFGLWCSGLGNRRWAVLGTALAFGFMVNLKIHSGLYMLPVLAMLDARHGWRATLSALGLGLASALAPFAFHPGNSPYHYLQWVMMSTHHGLQTDDLALLLRRGLLYAVPVLAPLAAGARFPDRTRLAERLGLAWLVGNLAVITLALKPGAGLVHLLPLAPINMVAGAMLWKDRRHSAPDMTMFPPAWRTGLTFVFLIAVLWSGGVNGYRSGMQAGSIMRDAAAVDADIRTILATHHDRTIGMGYGGEGTHFRHTYQRPLLAFAEQPMLIDVVAQMDAQRAHVDLSPATLDCFDDGMIDIWLIPRGQTPFAKRNWYPPHEEIFSPELREHFLAHYRLEETSEFFDLWAWQRESFAGAGSTARASR